MFFNLSYTKYKIRFVALEFAHLNEYHGSMIRGAMGRNLHKMFCYSDQATKCDNCNNHNSCLYVNLFYGIRPLQKNGKLSDMSKVPNPYVIKPLSQGKKVYERGDYLDFELTLIGDEAINHSPWYLLAIKEITSFSALGKYYNFKMVEIKNGVTLEGIKFNNLKHPETIPRYSIKSPKIDFINNKTLKMAIKTPLRIQSNGKLVDHLTFDIFIKAALRRLSMLTELYGHSQEENNYRLLIEKSKAIVCVSHHLKWLPLKRYSTFKNEYLSLGGLIGEIEFKGDFSDYWAILMWIEHLQLGKGTTNGEGWVSFQLK